MIDVALLGTGGTMPLPGRYLSSLLVRFAGRLILFDCGEGTQVSLRQLGWGLKDISHVLITHFHADHISGLSGLLLTIGNSGRTEPLTIVGPFGIEKVVKSLRVIAPRLPYKIVFKEMTGRGDEPLAIDALRLTCALGDNNKDDDPESGSEINPSIYEESAELTCALGDHEMTCLAYRIDLHRGRAFRPEKARELGIPEGPLWGLLQKGKSVPHEGKIVAPDDVLALPRPGLAMGFLTDSRPTARLIDFFKDVDLLVSEGTYGDPADKDKAVENKHMTFGEAAALASAARAKRLWLTHFSPALPNPDFFRREAESVFPGVVIGRDGMTTTLSFAD